MARPLIHPNLLGTLGNFFPHTLTIQEPAETQDGAGQAIASWADLAGHTNLAGLVVQTPDAGGQEQKKPQMSIVPGTHTLTLKGCYPIVTEKMRAVSGGVNYDILRALVDSQGLLTTLYCEAIT